MRYFVDERVGCIAVRDRERTDPEYPGLHFDTKGVVQYWSGVYEEMQRGLSGDVDGGWIVPEILRVEAHRLCNKLNAKGGE